mmetsp:Transcript_111468/g.302577  ORF Transcript_111468/g.302577 Transcript_111468/m.302577 type:complete len:253 (-) Transcript_111468:155-913(-)
MELLRDDVDTGGRRHPGGFQRLQPGRPHPRRVPPELRRLVRRGVRGVRGAVRHGLVLHDGVHGLAGDTDAPPRRRRRGGRFRGRREAHPWHGRPGWLGHGPRPPAGRVRQGRPGPGQLRQERQPKGLLQWPRACLPGGGQVQQCAQCATLRVPAATEELRQVVRQAAGLPRAGPHGQRLLFHPRRGRGHRRRLRAGLGGRAQDDVQLERHSADRAGGGAGALHRHPPDSHHRVVPRDLRAGPPAHALPRRQT